MSNYEALIIEYGTNDDRYEIDRVDVSTDTVTWQQLKSLKLKDVTSITPVADSVFAVGLCTGRIDSIADDCLVSQMVKAADIVPGDYVKIGEYHSSWHEFVVRRVTAVDKQSGTIYWDKPFDPDQIWHYRSFDDMRGAQFSVRRFTQVKNNFRTFLQKINPVNPDCQKYFIGMSPFNNNDYCSGWGYNEAIEDIALESGGNFVLVSDQLVAYDDSICNSADVTAIAIASTGEADYEVAANSLSNVNRSMRILVNGIDVTGTDAYIERTDGWYISQSALASAVTLTRSQDWNQMIKFATDYPSYPPKRAIKIHFYGNIPTTDDTIQLIVGNKGWSDDGVHQTDDGNKVYGKCLLQAIK